MLVILKFTISNLHSLIEMFNSSPHNKNLLDLAWLEKQVLVFLVIEVANFYQEVRNRLGSYSRSFTVLWTLPSVYFLISYFCVRIGYFNKSPFVCSPM